MHFGIGRKISNETAMLVLHSLGDLSVLGRVYMVESVRHNTPIGDLGIQCGLVGHNVDAISQATHNYDIVFGQLFYP